MALMGTSAFPITETLLLQTGVFSSDCFGFGDSYFGVGVMALFLPGLICQAVQDRMDRIFDVQCMGSRGRGTFVVNMWRLCMAHGLQIAALITFLCCNYVYVGTGMYALLLPCFVFIGVGSSITYGTQVKQLTLCCAAGPPRPHPTSNRC